MNLIDKFGLTKATAADLKDEVSALKSMLIHTLGEGSHEGELYRVALVHRLAVKVEWEKVAIALAKAAGLSEMDLAQVVAEYTSHNPTWDARCYARSGKKDTIQSSL
jgi:hypothetical protein